MYHGITSKKSGGLKNAVFRQNDHYSNVFSAQKWLWMIYSFQIRDSKPSTFSLTRYKVLSATMHSRYQTMHMLSATPAISFQTYSSAARRMKSPFGWLPSAKFACLLPVADPEIWQGGFTLACAAQRKKSVTTPLFVRLKVINVSSYMARVHAVFSFSALPATILCDS